MTNVNTATFERRFDLRGSQVAWITSAEEIGAAVFSLVFGYLGTSMHKGRLISVGAAVFALGSFTMMTPQLFFGMYELGNKPPENCDVAGLVPAYINLAGNRKALFVGDLNISNPSDIYIYISSLDLLGEFAYIVVCLYTTVHFGVYLSSDFCRMRWVD